MSICPEEGHIKIGPFDCSSLCLPVLHSMTALFHISFLDILTMILEFMEYKNGI